MRIERGLISGHVLVAKHAAVRGKNVTRPVENVSSNSQSQIFSPRAVYDTRKNLFSFHALKLGPSNSQEVIFCFLFIVSFSFLLSFWFDVNLSETHPDPGGRVPKSIKSE